MEQSIRENGLLKKIRRTVEAYKFGQMGLDMMDFGKTVWPMVMGDQFTLKEMFMKVNGMKTKPMAMEFTHISTEADMRASGSKTSNMEQELSNGQMELNTKANMNQG